MYLSLGDQPARRGGNCLLAGNSTSHRRWRYCCNIAQLREVFPACAACNDSMKKADSSDSLAILHRDCTHCTNWMLCSLDSHLLQYKMAASFPKGYLLGGVPANGAVPGVSPILLTYDLLKEIIKTTHDNICSQKWSPKEATTYLGANAISTKYAKKVVKYAKNCLKYQLAFDNRDKDKDDVYEEVELEKQKKDD